MAAKHGSKSGLWLAKYNVAGQTNDVAPGVTLDVIDVTPEGGATDKQFLPGLLSWKFSAKGFFDGGAAGTMDAILAALLGAAHQVIHTPGEMAAGAIAYAGYGSLGERYQVSSPLNGAVAVEFDVNGNNVLARAKVLGQKTATGAENGAAFDLGAAGTLGVESFLAVTAFSGTSATLKVQSSADGLSGWADRVTHTAVTSATSERVASGTTTDRYLRYALTGTFSSITFILAARNVGQYGFAAG